MRIALLALGLVLLGTSAAVAGDPAPGYLDDEAVPGLVAPTGIAFLPDGRMLIAEKGGALRLATGATVTTLVTFPVCDVSLKGLLDVAVDPDFATNGFIYLYNENVAPCFMTGPNQVVRLTMALDGTVSMASLVVVLTGITTGDHDGGGLRFGPDGKLYVAVGDTGLGDSVGCPGTSTNPFAQDLGVLEGKLLRLEPDGSIPADNPFVGQVGKRGEIFASGFRNPWRFDFDPSTGRLWLADVGDNAFEEIDIVVAGGNYGWPRCEANHPVGCALPGDVPPVFAYSHNGPCPGETMDSLGKSITGGAFTGNAFPGQVGSYVFGDFVGNAIYLAPMNASRDGFAAAPAAIVSNAAAPVDIVRGPDGAIYYVSIDTGSVRRVATVPAMPAQPLPGKKLVLTDNADPAKRGLTAIAKDLTINLGGGNGSGDDPTISGGSLRVVTSSGCGGSGCDTTYPLLAAGPNGAWGYLGKPGAEKGYQWKSKVGPVKRIAVQRGKQIKVKGKGALGHELAADPGPVDVVLQIGSRRYCMRFGGTTKFTAGKRFLAKDAGAPADCPS